MKSISKRLKLLIYVFATLVSFTIAGIIGLSKPKDVKAADNVTWNVNTATSWNNYVDIINARTAQGITGTTYTINITDNITHSASTVQAIKLASGDSLTINGNGHTITKQMTKTDNPKGCPIEVTSKTGNVSVTINNLTISDNLNGKTADISQRINSSWFAIGVGKVDYDNYTATTGTMTVNINNVNVTNYGGSAFGASALYGGSVNLTLNNCSGTNLGSNFVTLGDPVTSTKNGNVTCTIAGSCTAKNYYYNGISVMPGCTVNICYGATLTLEPGSSSYNTTGILLAKHEASGLTSSSVNVYYAGKYVFNSSTNGKAVYIYDGTFNLRSTGGIMQLNNLTTGNVSSAKGGGIYATKSGLLGANVNIESGSTVNVNSAANTVWLYSESGNNGTVTVNSAPAYSSNSYVYVGKAIKCSTLPTAANLRINSSMSNGATVINCTSAAQSLAHYKWDFPYGDGVYLKQSGSNVLWMKTHNVTLNGNGATTAGTTALTTLYSTGTYINGSRMTTSANPITLPTKYFTVTYNSNGGSSCSSQNANAAFNGYYNASSGGTQYITASGYITSSGLYGTYVKSATSDSAPLKSIGTGILYAHWTNGSITLPTPTRTGYTFAGWYTAASGGTLIGNAGATYTPTAPITLYAHWTANSYTQTVSYRLQNADGSYPSTYTVAKTQSVSYGSTFSYNASDIGLNTAQYDTSGKSVSYTVAGAQTTNLDIPRVTYVLTLGKDTGISTVSGAGSYRWGQSVTVSAVLSAGYRFKNWAGSGVSSSDSVAYTFTMPASAVSLTATSLAPYPSASIVVDAPETVSAGKNVVLSMTDTNSGIAGYYWGKSVKYTDNERSALPENAKTARISKTVTEPGTYYFTVESRSESITTIAMTFKQIELDCNFGIIASLTDDYTSKPDDIVPISINPIYESVSATSISYTGQPASMYGAEIKMRFPLPARKGCTLKGFSLSPLANTGNREIMVSAADFAQKWYAIWDDAIVPTGKCDQTGISDEAVVMNLMLYDTAVGEYKSGSDIAGYYIGTDEEYVKNTYIPVSKDSENGYRLNEKVIISPAFEEEDVSSRKISVSTTSGAVLEIAAGENFTLYVFPVDGAGNVGKAIPSPYTGEDGFTFYRIILDANGSDADPAYISKTDKAQRRVLYLPEKYIYSFPAAERAGYHGPHDPNKSNTSTTWCEIGGTGLVSGYESVTIQREQTYFANWIANVYTITYDNNEPVGGNVVTDASTGSVGTIGTIGSTGAQIGMSARLPSLPCTYVTYNDEPVNVDYINDPSITSKLAPSTNVIYSPFVLSYPSVYGWTFLGWFDSELYKIEYDLTESGISNLPYVVPDYAPAGSQTTAFAGNSYDTDAIEVYSSSGKICTHSGKYQSEGRWHYDSDVTLYAHWMADKFLIVYDINEDDARDFLKRGSVCEGSVRSVCGEEMQLAIYDSSVILITSKASKTVVKKDALGFEVAHVKAWSKDATVSATEDEDAVLQQIGVIKTGGKITYDNPVSVNELVDDGSSAGSDSNRILVYAVWDYAPVIEAGELVMTETDLNAIAGDENSENLIADWIVNRINIFDIEDGVPESADLIWVKIIDDAALCTGESMQTKSAVYPSDDPDLLIGDMAVRVRDIDIFLQEMSFFTKPASTQVYIASTDTFGNETVRAITVWFQPAGSNEDIDGDIRLNHPKLSAAYANIRRTRFIDERFYNASKYADWDNYKMLGALRPTSVWLENEEYNIVLSTTFENIRNSVYKAKYEFTHEQCLATQIYNDGESAYLEIAAARGRAYADSIKALLADSYLAKGHKITNLSDEGAGSVTVFTADWMKLVREWGCEKEEKWNK